MGSDCLFKLQSKFIMGNGKCYIASCTLKASSLSFPCPALNFFFFFKNECTIASCLQAPESNSDTQTFVCIFCDITQAKLVKFKQLLFLARPDSNLLVGAWQSESMDQPASSTGQPAPLDPV